MACTEPTLLSKHTLQFAMEYIPDSTHESGRMISTWIVDDHNGFRETMQELINLEDEFRCPLTFENCEGMLDTLRYQLPPDVVLMDIEIPDYMSGIEGVRELAKRRIDTKAVMLTNHSDDDNIFQALCAGAVGYVLKKENEDKILEAVEAAHSGGGVMSPVIAGRVFKMFTQFAPASEDYNLSERELEVLRLLVDGLTKREIADKIFRAFSTVDSHMRNIYRKLHVHSRSEAVVKALKERLI